jgi:cytochrome c556
MTIYGHPSLMNRPALIAILLGVIAWWTSTALTQPQAAIEEHKETLREIMQDFGAEYLRLSNALLMDDFKLLEESAKAIQSDPLPDAIVAAIKTRLGRSFRAFERADEQSRRGAADLAKSAAAKDLVGSAKAFGAMTNGCVSCHKQFRATLRSLSN